MCLVRTAGRQDWRVYSLVVGDVGTRGTHLMSIWVLAPACTSSVDIVLLAGSLAPILAEFPSKDRRTDTEDS